MQTQEASAPRRRQQPATDPLLVSASEARRLGGWGNTKFWALVKTGKIKMVSGAGPRRMVVYASLKALASA